MGYLTGIDCGATGTDVLLYNDKTRSGKLYKFNAINFNLLGLDKTVMQLNVIIKKSTGSRLKNTDYIVAGISGARNSADRKKIQIKLQKSLNFRNIEIYPDTEIALYGAFGNDKNCGILIAGTGSVIYYRDSKGKANRIGGWGRHIGDEGSGYWIARSAIHRLTQCYDGRSAKTSLSIRLNRKLNINSSNIVKHIYHNDFEISGIAKLVFECAEAGDKICRQIITKAAENLSEHFVPLRNKMRNKKIKIALCGSLFTKEKLLEKDLKKIIKKNYPGIKLVKPDAEPVWGAVKIGMNNISGSFGE